MCLNPISITREIAGRKYTQVEIAKEVNISQSYLSRVIKDILNKIKNRLIEEHVIIEKHLK